jgi:hypothetical protein
MGTPDSQPAATSAGGALVELDLAEEAKLRSRAAELERRAVGLQAARDEALEQLAALRQVRVHAGREVQHTQPSGRASTHL